MAILRGYLCDCGTNFEHMHRPQNDVAKCPACKRVASEKDEVLGGRTFHTIIPMYKGSLKQKAGYVHSHGDKPAEKGSVAVPSKGNF